MKTVLSALAALVTAVIILFMYALGLAHGVKLAKVTGLNSSKHYQYTPGPVGKVS